MSRIIPISREGILNLGQSAKTPNFFHEVYKDAPYYLGCIEITNDNVIFHKYEQPCKVGYWEMKYTDTGCVTIRYWNGQYVLFHKTGRNTTRSRNSYEFVRFIGE